METLVSYWLNRETTDPRHMESSFRYAAMIPGKFRGDNSFCFPYHKLIDGKSQVVYVSKKTAWHDKDHRFSIDIGQITDASHFKSNAWIDFRVVKEGYGNEAWYFGEGSTEHEVYGDLLRKRPHEPVRGELACSTWFKSYYSYGIYVVPELRRSGIGTNLITATRVMLNHLNIDEFIIKQANPNSGFNKNLRPLKLEKKDPFSSEEYNDLVLPTQATPEYPHIFR
jgi:GNAT superfamily N-acetyltransferase